MLSQWPIGGGLTIDALTTVGNWRSYGSVEVDGVHYGQKAHSVRTLLRIARRSSKPLRVALAIDPSEVRDLIALADAGWRTADPALVASTPDDYRDFVEGIGGELGLAKSGYVTAVPAGSATGAPRTLRLGGRWWRTTRASWAFFRPAVGSAFDGVESALDAIRRVADDYELHRVAARDFAERHLDSGRVLSRLLDRVGAA